MNALRSISDGGGPAEDLPLYGIAAARSLEASLAATVAPHVLMQRAGLAVARLCMALAPHADRIWIAAGPGNNGGDGFEAAALLQRAGKNVLVSAIGDAARRPTDATASLARAQQAGVRIEAGLGGDAAAQCGIAVDALFGLGATRAVEGDLAAALRVFNAQRVPRLAIDLPSGLDAETGVATGPAAAASDTLAMLTLKPGLFTAQGRDQAGRVWFDDLGLADTSGLVPVAPCAWLGGAAAARDLSTPRRHAQHKGSFGDVVVVGGATGMAGAALLAGRAASGAGAGRVFVCLLDAAAAGHDPLWPELMLRPEHWRSTGAAGAASTVVCGSGGGDAVRETLPLLLARAARLVLDADALNAVAADAVLQTLLRARAGRGLATVLTPHPLEAARLLALPGAAAVQADRLGHAGQLADRFECVVVLKGSGTVIAAPNEVPLITASGNARLASAGTGDVLAGWLGGLWSAAQASAAMTVHRLAHAACWLHGRAAERDGDGPEADEAQRALPASMLIERLARG